MYHVLYHSTNVFPLLSLVVYMKSKFSKPLEIVFSCLIKHVFAQNATTSWRLITSLQIKS